MEFLDKRIVSLSGVYSTIYLKPKESQFIELKKASLILPLFLLLGDKHFEQTGLCTDCKCQDGGCCEIYDPLFLQELDSLATKENPIDFYTELFFAPLEVKGIAQYFSDPEFRVCYQRHDTKEYIEKCPTKHIRWQYTDVRQSVNTLESSFVIIRDILDGNIDLINQLNIDVLELLLTLYDETTKTFDTRTFSERFFRIASNKNENSIIRKQMLKQTYVNFRDVGYMSMVLEKGIEHIISENNLAIFFYKGKFNQIIRLLISITKGDIPDIDPYIKLFKICAVIMTAINCIWMDLYFILRSFKTPDGFNHPSSLCIGFFGNEHVTSISYLLTDIMDLYYLDFVSYSNDSQERCTPIQKPIRIIKDIETHNENKHIPVLERDNETQRYHGILVHFYERSPKQKRRLTRKKRSPRKHRKSSNDFYIDS